ncbi:MAG: type III-A CRISPR-associated protein Csm2, partial [Candidatus Cloacimonetes bacterium]|nr:type III-A CRISPR-associated protein Csm2 [Candidatus Cloacimonadota bacterium]
KQLAEEINTRDLKSTALRNFYNEFLRIKHLPENNNEEKKILIRLLVSKAHYKKTTANLPDRFVSFIEKLINEVNDDLKKFDKACLVMEAIVGYFPKR